MRRGTTPTHYFTIPEKLVGIVKTVRITYSQLGNVVLQKETADCEISGDTISVKLTQEETLKFNSGIAAKIQARILTMGGEAVASDPLTVDVEALLDDGVLE